jgi:hypothetical protein
MGRYEIKTENESLSWFSYGSSDRSNKKVGRIKARKIQVSLYMHIVYFNQHLETNMLHNKILHWQLQRFKLFSISLSLLSLKVMKQYLGNKFQHHKHSVSITKTNQLANAHQETKCCLFSEP